MKAVSGIVLGRARRWADIVSGFLPAEKSTYAWCLGSLMAISVV
jgi:hypothetical protein